MEEPNRRFSASEEYDEESNLTRPRVDSSEPPRRKGRNSIELESIRAVKPPKYSGGPFLSQQGGSLQQDRPRIVSGSKPPRTCLSAPKDDFLTAKIKALSWELQMVLSNVFYFLSLKSCDLSYRQCQKAHSYEIKYWVIFLMASAFILSATFLGLFDRMILSWAKEGRPSNKLIVQGFVTIFDYFWLCSLREGLSWKAHGTFSRIVFNYFLIIFTVIRLFRSFIKRLKKKKKTQTAYLIQGSIAVYLIYELYCRVWLSRKDFYEGFNGVKISNDPKECHFHHFSLNYFSAFDDLFWGFSHSKSSCWPKTKDLWWVKQKNPHISNGAKIIAYPLTNNLNETTRQHFQLLQDSIIKNMKEIKSQKEIKTVPEEVFIDLSSGYPLVKIDVKRNETLVKENKKIIEKENMQRPNVLMIILDSMSRQHFFRKMKKTKAFFEENFFNHASKSEGQTKLSAYQFFRYHSLDTHPEANLISLRYDDIQVEGETTSRVRIERYFKEKGWITSVASSKCEINEYDIDIHKKNKVYPDHHPLDHEFYSLACDPNAMPQKDPFGMFKGPFSEFRRCLYGNDASSYQLDYSLDFWRKYKNEPKFQSVMLMDGHEFTGELPVYLDDHLEKYFKKMLQENLLNNSIVFLLSDSGNRENFLFSHTSSGRNELMNPFLTILLSSNLPETYHSSLSSNQQSLLSPLDIFRALGELSNSYKEYAGLNPLSHPIPRERECPDAGIDTGLCRCKKKEGW